MPRPVEFEGLGRCFYRRLDLRAPKKGEYYLSGAIVMAYKAPNDYPDNYLYQIVQPTHHVVFMNIEVHGEPVK